MSKQDQVTKDYHECGLYELQLEERKMINSNTKHVLNIDSSLTEIMYVERSALSHRCSPTLVFQSVTIQLLKKKSPELETLLEQAF